MVYPNRALGKKPGFSRFISHNGMGHSKLSDLLKLRNETFFWTGAVELLNFRVSADGILAR